jgi:hypothetical protein
MIRRKIATPASKPVTASSKRTVSPKRTVAKVGAKKSGAPVKATPIVHGAKGFEVGEQKQAAQQARYDKMKDTPYRFRLKPGEEAELVILDSEELFFVSEHTIKHKGRWENVVCIADSGVTCPLCEHEGREGSYTLMLTVLDRRPYTNKKGETVKISKKLLPVKGRNMAKFKRAFEQRFAKDFRGVVINCARSGEKEAGIGEDISFDKRIAEPVLAKYKDLAKPADYSNIFTVLSADEMSKTYGLGSGGGTKRVAGSADFGGDEEDGDLGNVGGW